MFRAAFLFAAAALLLAAPVTPRSMRVDYVHSGTASEESFALDGVALEGQWAGPRDGWIDESNLGKYQFRVEDAATKQLLYSRGFASIYGEWETTDEAKQTRRAFSESVRFPAPSAPVRVAIAKRGESGDFRELWSAQVDPKDTQIDRAPAPKLNVWAVMQNGSPQEKVDLLLLGDGYTAAEMPKWHRDARRLTETLFAASPFKEHRRQFNVWAIDTPAAQSGVSRPGDGIYRRSPLRAAYDAFGSERYVLTFDNKRMREIAAAAPYEFVEIVVNGRKYGGGGIFNLYATVASDNEFTPYVFVHEFGHHFAGLADEYYTSDVAYGSSSARPEPWEPNVTADALAEKWKDLLTPGVALPTPWPKAQFEETERGIQARRKAIRAEHRPEAEMEALFREQRKAEAKLFSAAPNASKVGAFEGAMYEASGYYRSQQDCIMFTRYDRFCAACRRAIERVIAMYAR
jgi:hypothetical protein